MPIPPYSGSLDLVLLMLQRMAQSAAFATEVARYKSILSIPASLTYTIADANNVKSTIDLAPADLPNLSYIADTLAQVHITPQQKLLPPFPVMELSGMPGRIQSAAGGSQYRNEAIEGEVYRIDCVIWAASSDDPQRISLESVTLATCFKTLIRRNEHLGGLVQLIQPSSGPVEALAGGPHMGTTVGGSRMRFEVLVAIP